MTNKANGHEQRLRFFDQRERPTVRGGHDNSKKTTTTNKPTWDLAAAKIFSSSCSGSNSSWNDSYNGDSHTDNICRTDFLPHHNSAVFCREHTPPPKHKETSVNDLWAEPVSSYMLPTPSPTHNTSPTHSTASTTANTTHNTTTHDISLNPQSPAFKPHTNTRKHFIHLKFLQKKHALTNHIHFNPSSPTFIPTDTHMNDTLPLNENLNVITPHSSASALPHMPDLSPIHTSQPHSLHTISLLSPITMYYPKNIDINTTTNNNHSNIELNFPEETLFFENLKEQS